MVRDWFSDLFSDYYNDLGIRGVDVTMRSDDLRRENLKLGSRTLAMRTEDVRKVKAVARNHALAVISRLMLMSADKLKDLFENPNTTATELAVASILRKVIKQGDALSMQFLMNYVVGKPSTYDPGPEDLSAAQRAHLAQIPSHLLTEFLKQSESVPAAPIPVNPIPPVSVSGERERS